jgi:hypothetical protein
MAKRAAVAADQARRLRGDPQPEQPSGGAIDRILWNHGRETIDEIVVHNCTVHVEQMDDRCWWIGVYKGDEQMWTGNFHCYRHKDGMKFTEQDDDLEWDREDEHR